MLPDTLEYIDRGAISNLGITELTIPESVKVIESHAIGGCPNLETIRVYSSRTGHADYYGDCCMGFCWNDATSSYVANSSLVVWGVITGDKSAEETDIQRWCRESDVNFSGFPPTNPHWDGNTAKWDKAASPEGTNCYRLSIYKDGKFVGEPSASTNSLDLTSFMMSRGRGTYTFQVSYYASDLSELSAGRNYTGAVNTYTLTFNANTGTGTMDPITAEAGDPFALPACTFTAPSDDKDFLCWRVEGEELSPGQPVSLIRDTEANALWKDKSDPGIKYAAEIADLTFQTTPVDYEVCPIVTVTIRNTGNRTLRNLDVTLSDNKKGAFTLCGGNNGETIGVDSDHTGFYLEAKPGLAIGTYTAKVTVMAEWLPEPVTADVSLTIRDHNWSSEWETSYTSHWHPCLDELCFKRKDEGPHDSKITEGAYEPTFDTDGSTGVKKCSVCGAVVENAQPIAAGKYIRKSTATTIPAVITDEYRGRDLAFESGDSSKYTIEPDKIWDHTAEEYIDENDYFIPGHEYSIRILFQAVEPYVYDEMHSTHGSEFYVNGQETDTPMMLSYSPVRTYRFTAKKAIVPSLNLSETSFTYNGQVQKPDITVWDGNTELDASQYEVTYSPAGCKNAGNYSITVELKGEYYGSTTESFKITAKKITPTVTLSASSYTYDGKVKKPNMTVKDGSTKLAASQYTVTYKNNKNVGKASASVTLKGNYSGSKTVTFKINPKGTSLKTLTKASKAVTVKWTKQAAKMSSRITGYQIQLATDSKFIKNKKTVTVKGYSKTSKKVTGLKGGKKYYVRIRTYKTVSGTNYYSPWSKVKTVTTKK